MSRNKLHRDEDITDIVQNLIRRVTTLETSSQMAFNSVHMGSVDVYNEDMEVVLKYGLQSDNRYALVYTEGPECPQPSPPAVTPIMLGLSVRWDGNFTFFDGTPTDFSHVEVHLSTQSGFTEGPDTLADTIERGGGTAVISPLQVRTYFVSLVGVTRSGGLSVPSAEVSATPDQVVAADLLDGIVDTLALADNAVTQAKVAVDAIGTAQIIDRSVTVSELSDGSVDASKIVADAIGPDALQVDAVTASAIAADAIGTSELAANSVVAGTIASDSIETRHITAGAIQAGQIAAGAVQAGEIAANAVTAAEIAALSVTADEIAANAVTAGKIDAGAVTTDALAANSVTTDILAAESVISETIAARSVVTDLVSSGSITADKLSLGSGSENLFANGGFEDPLTVPPPNDQWSRANFLTPHSGNWILLFTTFPGSQPDGIDYFFAQGLPISGSTTVTVSFWGSRGNEPINVDIIARFSASTERKTHFSGFSSGHYTRHQVAFNVPMGETTVDIGFSAVSDPGGGGAVFAQFDDVIIVGDQTNVIFGDFGERIVSTLNIPDDGVGPLEIMDPAAGSLRFDPNEIRKFLPGGSQGTFFVNPGGPVRLGSGGKDIDGFDFGLASNRTPNASGEFQILHTLAATPRFAFAAPNEGSSQQYCRYVPASSNASQITFTAHSISDGSQTPGNKLDVFWIAIG